jgi:hypothetical protein
MFRGFSVRKVCLGILAFLQGTRCIWITNAKHAKLVLQASANKGHFIEEHIAMPAWAPILSLESTNGEQHRRLNEKFHIFTRLLPRVQDLAMISERLTSELIGQKEDACGLICSKDIVCLTSRIFVTWLFGEEECIKFNAQKQDILYFACEEWRKQLAMKDAGCMQMKHDGVEIIIEMLERSEQYSLICDARHYDNAEVYSVVMQPFIISPMINISDICVAWFDSKHKLPCTNNDIMRCISQQHPFPILERFIEYNLYDPINNELIVPAFTQVFIPLDENSNNKSECSSEKENGAQNIRNSNWIAFGAGERRCGGTIYALNVLRPMLCQLELARPIVHARVGHAWSGRHNDSSTVTFFQTFYQMKVILHIYYKVLIQYLKSI